MNQYKVKSKYIYTSVQDNKRHDGTKWLMTHKFSILELLWEWSSEERKSPHWETVIKWPSFTMVTRTGGTLIRGDEGRSHYRWMVQHRPPTGVGEA